MTHRVDELIRKIRELEEEMEIEFKNRREEFEFIIEEKRVRFSEEVTRQHRRLKTGLYRYITRAHPLNVLTAPVIYSGFVPFLMLDLFLWIYQASCFPIYGIPKVARSEYLVFDRTDLPYLNAVERFNCFYCSYANGLLPTPAKLRRARNSTGAPSSMRAASAPPTAAIRAFLNTAMPRVTAKGWRG
jgi:hypothetical protein